MDFFLEVRYGQFELNLFFLMNKSENYWDEFRCFWDWLYWCVWVFNFKGLIVRSTVNDNIITLKLFVFNV